MADQDFYDVLGVQKNASRDEIRKAYKKLARKYHPDANPDDESAAEQFKKIQQAYAVLNDPDKRSKYDQFGHAFEHAGQGAQFNWSADGAQFDLDDLLGGMFGGGGRGGFGGFGGGQRRQQAVKGEDLRTEIGVPFMLAAEGGSYELQVHRGSTAEKLNIKVPPGVDTGSVIRLSGQGRPGVGGGPAGDLLVTIRAHPHPYFRREGNNLLVDVPVTPSEAVLGAKIDVPTLNDGTVVLTVPPGTSSGAKLRLRGKGIPDRKTKTRGDQYVVIKVDVPQDLDEHSRSLYKQLAESNPVNPRADLW